MRRRLWNTLWIVLVGLGSYLIPISPILPTSPGLVPGSAARETAQLRPRINVPYNVPGSESPVFWFGQVTPSDNYADVRVGYRDAYVFVHLNIMDRRLWYDVTPSPAELLDWDAVSLYLNGDTSNPSSSYRFDAQLVWWEDRSPYQAAYRADTGAWSLVDVPFTTESSWSGDVPNTDVDDRGWSLLYRIPYTSLGLNGPPAQGTVWDMALALHDRDAAAGPVLPIQTWPVAMSPADRATWGELVFGVLPPYVPPPALPGGVLSIRHGVNDAVVMDADVGGSSVCGSAAAPDFFSRWGTLNYAGKTFLNVQNLGYISEWPCFSKYYVTFPLDALPPGKAVLSAQLTLYLFGTAGAGEAPTPSLIQVSIVDQPWEEANLNWNNAPLPVENIATTWVEPLETTPPWPGIPKEWDVSIAVARAYAAGTPVRLVLYSPAWDFHSGRYFYSSDIAGNGEGRPTLTIHWGEPIAALEKDADKTDANYGDMIQYTLGFLGVGVTTTITDTLPEGVVWTGAVELSGTTVEPVYDPIQHRLTWEDTPAPGEQVRITYTVSVDTLDRRLIVNVAELTDQAGRTSSTTSAVLANSIRCYLPVILKL